MNRAAIALITSFILLSHGIARAATICAGISQADVVKLAFMDPGSAPDATGNTPQNPSVAPSSDVSDAQIADTASRTRILAVATQMGLIDRESGALAISISPFAWAALADSAVNEDQVRYTEWSNARRFTGKISAGGQGEEFDRDGDGQADPPLDAKSLGDIVSYEIAWRFAGSRDPRDRANVDLYAKDVASKFVFNIDSLARLTESFGKAQIDAADRAGLEPATFEYDVSTENCALLLQAIRDRRPEFEALNADFNRDLAMHRARTLDWAAKIDAGFIASIVASGTERKPLYGGDRQSIGLRASWGLVPDAVRRDGDVCATCSSGQTVDISLDYIRNELPIGTDELEGVKLGARFDARFPEFPGFGWKDAILTASLSAERYSDVPMGMEDSIAKASVGVSFKLSEAVKVPFSITWANRTSLLQDEDEVVGNVGISYDLDSIFGGPSQAVR
jgi:hypothetical protein